MIITPLYFKFKFHQIVLMALLNKIIQAPQSNKNDYLLTDYGKIMATLIRTFSFLFETDSIGSVNNRPRAG